MFLSGFLDCCCFEHEFIVDSMLSHPLKRDFFQKAAVVGGV